MTYTGWESILKDLNEDGERLLKIPSLSAGLKEALEQQREKDQEFKRLIRSSLGAGSVTQMNGPLVKPFEMPKWEPFEPNYDWMDVIVTDNSKYGWTMTGEMNLYAYLDESLLQMNQEEKDEYFFQYYHRNNWETLAFTEEEILKSIQPKWQPLIKSSFQGFREDNIQLIIPALFSIIEGRLAELVPNKRKVVGMIKTIKEKAEGDKYGFHRIALYSVLRSVEDVLFVSKPFDEPRGPLINRHWVLHGRDNPNLWTQIDALRLFTVISSIQFIEDFVQNN